MRVPTRSFQPRVDSSGLLPLVAVSAVPPAALVAPVLDSRPGTDGNGTVREGPLRAAIGSLSVLLVVAMALQVGLGTRVSAVAPGQFEARVLAVRDGDQASQSETDNVPDATVPAGADRRAATDTESSEGHGERGHVAHAAHDIRMHHGGVYSERCLPPPFRA
jgi:hypothetical protein